MRILYGHDYYDYAMQYGRDDDLLFVRERDRRIKRTDVPMDEIGRGIAFSINFTPIRFHRRYNNPNASASAIVVAGRVYRFATVVTNSFEEGFRSRIAWSDRDIDRILEEFDATVDRSPRRMTRFGVDIPTHHFDLGAGERVDGRGLEWLIENRAAILAPDLSPHRVVSEYLVNAPILGTGFEMFRVLDGMQAMQELQYFVGNYLNPRVGTAPPRQKGTVVLSQESRMTKHGMDETSFRRPKGGKVRSRRAQTG